MGKMRKTRKTRKTKKERTVPLSVFYVKYLICLFIGAIIILAAAVAVFNALVESDMVYPANYAERQAQSAYEEILQAREMKEEMVPQLCRYTFFDKEGNIERTTMKEKDAKNIWEKMQEEEARLPKGSALSGMQVQIGTFYYKAIVLPDGYGVLQYQVVPQYKSQIMRQYFGQPEITIICGALVLMFMYVVCSAQHFGRVMRKKLHPLIAAAEMIRDEQLDFSVAAGGIKEIDDVSDALNQMREALKTSLEAQWQMQQRRKEQISALAHDLKTPLTLVRGNAEILSETELSGEQRECIDYILGSAGQMQTYVQMLIEVAKSEGPLPAQSKRADFSLFIKELEMQCRGLCAVKQISMQWNCRVLTREMIMDSVLLTRALLNIMANAVEYTPAGGAVIFDVYEKGGAVVFVISDSGEGFSKKALKYGTEQFYMEDESRGSKSHFGIGLYAADSIVKQHGGKLCLGNSRRLPGGEVTVEIPVFGALHGASIGEDND